MKGSCLCGNVTFELASRPVAFYRCHCSLCRKQTGTGYNLATLIRLADFSWTQGEDGVRSWSRPSGYRTDFCTNCGSTVPNVLRDSPYVWIPIGLLDDDLTLMCTGDYCVSDAHSWDNVRSEITHAGPVESLLSLIESLKLS
ncbi:GFA family protein [Pantoea cypripedii]|uniref:S-(Hydroxymethyl)glutathione synthase n=1 Tax=Pantoea cypripedii TaxID=55209 RepID=A0A6B9GHQ3_PANCY|nr:GFA family protein [Pantoea cypripedii]QGY33275.1 S-(hydroxymethyl)glutathione synthase [Pantoea cypripedii]